MKAILFILGLVVVLGLCSLAVGSASWMFWNTLKSRDIESFRVLVGSFSGAFFAYLFVRFGDALKKFYDRQELGHVTLVKLQHFLNDCLNTTSNNLFIVKECSGVFTEEKRDSREVPLYEHKFHQYETNRDLVLNLANIDLLNELYSLNVDLLKMNHTLATIDQAYGRLQDAFLAKNIDAQTYKENAWRHKDRCVEVREFLMEIDGELKRLFAVANLLIKNRPFFTQLTRRLVRSSYPKDFAVDVSKEKARLQLEIEANNKVNKYGSERSKHGSK